MSEGVGATLKWGAKSRKKSYGYDRPHLVHIVSFRLQQDYSFFNLEGK